MRSILRALRARGSGAVVSHCTMAAQPPAVGSTGRDAPLAVDPRIAVIPNLPEHQPTPQQIEDYVRTTQFRIVAPST